MQFRIWLENTTELKMHLWHLNHHHGQDDFVIYATDLNDVTLGRLEYSVFEEEPYIKWIEVANDMRRQGIARQMIQRLMSEGFSYNKIHWGMMTDDGSQLKAKLDQGFSSPSLPNVS